MYWAIALCISPGLPAGLFILLLFRPVTQLCSGCMKGVNQGSTSMTNLRSPTPFINVSSVINSALVIAERNLMHVVNLL